MDLTDDYKAAYDVISAAAASDNTVGFRSSFYTKLNDALFDQLQLLGTGLLHLKKQLLLLWLKRQQVFPNNKAGILLMLRTAARR